jgi:inosose dehydratase
VYARLRRLGELARRFDVTLVLETHPDLGTNGDVQLETMKGVHHPNVRVNFDTGNITFYNRDTDAATELAKIIDYVATVELKDHGGGYRAWDFPALGQGKTNFEGVFKILKQHNFRGPMTIEVEGVSGRTLDREQTKAVIAESVAFLRDLARSLDAAGNGTSNARTNR